MKEWFATLIDDLKFLGAEFKREFFGSGDQADDGSGEPTET